MPQPFPNHTPDNNDALVLPNRRSAKAYVRAIVRDSSTATGVTVYVDDQAAAASAASKSAAAASSDAAASNGPLLAQPDPSAYHAAQKWLAHAEDGAALRYHV